MPLRRIAHRPVGVAVVIVLLITVPVSMPSSAVEEPQGLIIGDAGVGLRGTRYYAPSVPLPNPLQAVVALVVENPNSGFAAEGVQFELTVYGQNDQRIHIERFAVPQVLPLERRGLVANITIMQERLPVSRVEAAAVFIARWVPVRAVPLLEITRVSAQPGFHGDLFDETGWIGAIAGPNATGTLTNPLDAALGQVIIAGIVYDLDGRVAGGSVRFESYWPPRFSDRVSTATLVYGTDIESRGLIGASWGRAEMFAAYPWIDLTPYRR
jgi:hypothetical protein